MIDISNKQLISEGLEFPTSLCFDDNGTAYVAESGLTFGGGKPGGRVLRIEANGSHTCLLDNLGVPLNGLACKGRALYISEGGNPGRISRLDLDSGQFSVLLDNLPGLGNYQTCMVAFGPDGKLYFSQGALTNHGIMGLDAYELGWLRCLPHNHDIPGYNIVLTGASVETADPLAAARSAPAPARSLPSARCCRRERACKANCPAPLRSCAVTKTAPNWSWWPGGCVIPTGWVLPRAGACWPPTKALMTAAAGRRTTPRTFCSRSSRMPGTAGRTSSAACRPPPRASAPAGGLPSSHC
jgi:hypothetical protein